LFPNNKNEQVNFVRSDFSESMPQEFIFKYCLIQNKSDKVCYLRNEFFKRWKKDY